MAVQHIISIAVILAAVIAAEKSSKVELHVSCAGLLDRDMTSKSDPMCVVFMHDAATKKWYEAGRTEDISDNLNPNFVRSIEVDYYFEEEQNLRLEVYDKDSSSAKLKHHDFLGKLEETVTLGQIVSSKTLTRPLVMNGKPAGKGTCTIYAEELSGSREEVHFKFFAHKLDDKDFFGKSDPFMIIYRYSDGGPPLPIHKTEVINNNLNPSWRPFELTMEHYRNEDFDKTGLLFEIYDYEDDGSHDFIGQFETTYGEMSKAAKPVQYECTNPKKNKRSSKNCGVITLQSFKGVKKSG